MRVPDEIRDCVVFLGVHVMREGGIIEDRWGGTGFLLSVVSEALPDKGWTYLVTAKHVADELGKGIGIVRLNVKDGDAVTARFGPDARWYFHPDADRVDVAVFPFPSGNDQLDQRAIPSDMLLTDEIIREKNLGHGDEVFMTGLFSHVTGRVRSVPIVRMGNVAMMPDDTIPTQLGEIEAYLIEARSIGGLSGSPVFVRDTSNVYANAASVPFYLMGLMHGHWKVPQGDVNVTPLHDFADTNETINMGIAIVVPAKKILEVLNMPELRAKRAEEEKAFRDQNLPTMDSDMSETAGHKTPAKPVSLYPMDEEEALKRLLRVPPPGKDK